MSNNEEEAQYDDECADMQILPEDRRFADACSLVPGHVMILRAEFALLIILAIVLGILTPVTFYTSCINDQSCSSLGRNVSQTILAYSNSSFAKVIANALVCQWVAVQAHVFYMSCHVEYMSVRLNFAVMVFKMLAIAICTWLAVAFACSLVVLLCCQIPLFV